MRSVRPEERAEVTRFGNIRLPLLRRIEVGSRSLISFAKEDSRDEGSREVVTRTRGSITPLSWAYSSSSSNSSSVVRSARDSSYLKSFRSSLSFAISGAKGFPLAREAFSLALFSAISASRRVRARRYR